ncbi:MAG: zinc-ribbon domain-containing protein, partial [Mycobacterium sp.]
MTGDIVCRPWKLIIEFDGWYFHRRREARVRDREKTELLEGRGWTVIRVRDGLTPLGSNDVTVCRRASALQRAKAVVRKAYDLGFNDARFDHYLKSDQPWAGIAAAAQLRRGVPYEKSLTAVHPEIAAEWHPSLNGSLRPTDMYPTRVLRVWWRCSTCSHEWEA